MEDTIQDVIAEWEELIKSDPDLQAAHAEFERMHNSPEAVAYRQTLAALHSDPDYIADEALIKKRLPDGTSFNDPEERFKTAEECLIQSRSYLGRIRSVYHTARANRELENGYHGALKPLMQQLRETRELSAGMFFVFAFLSVLTLGAMALVLFFPPVREFLMHIATSPILLYVLGAIIVILLWIYAGFGTAFFSALILGFLSWVLSGTVVAGWIVRIVIMILLLILFVAFAFFGASNHLAALTGVKRRRLLLRQAECRIHIKAALDALTLCEEAISSPNEEAKIQLAYFYTSAPDWSAACREDIKELRAYYERALSAVNHG